MNRGELQEVVSRLEALEALAKLFNNLWFDQIKRDITDSKVQAYLMVFEDAFPHLNHVIEFVRKSADVLTDGPSDREHWSRLQEEFESLRLLLGGQQVADNRTGPLPPVGVAETEISDREKEALEAVGQGDIDALFENGSDSDLDDEDELGELDGLDELEMEEDIVELSGIAARKMEAEEAVEAAEALEEEIELPAAEEGESSDELMDLLGEEEGGEEPLEEEIELEDLLAEADDDVSETDGEELEDLLEEESADDASDDGEVASVDDDDFDLLEEGDADGGDAGGETDEGDLGAGISDEEMAALLEADDDEEESGDGKTAATGAEAEVESDEEESISQDEIDALFG